MFEINTKIDTSELDKFTKKVEEMEGKREVSMNDFCTVDFLSRCSSFTSFDNMLEMSGFKVETQDDFAAIPDDKFDAFISENTSFDSWEEMLQSAANEYYAQQLDL